MYNASPLFHKRLHTDRFVDNISITARQDHMLLTARKKIRQAIRTAFSEARTYLRDMAGIQERDIEWISKVRPKFMTQGSYAYKTLNAPCYSSQEVDLDDGVYLPMSIMNASPQANKDWFFAIVDGALKKLAAQEGWEFTSEKETCARVVISGGQAHIDVPLYAIPDERHDQMAKALAAMKIEGNQLSEALYQGDLRGALPYMLDEGEVYLATRKGGWRKSDPLLIANWFKQQVDLKGQRLRRICRFLKAWRDFVWESGGPSSLTLMICAADAYPEDDQGRDDYALMEVARALPQLLSGTIKNPAVEDSAGEGEIVYPRGNINQAEVAMSAAGLSSALEKALSGSFDKANVIEQCICQFGDRMPRKPEWVEDLGSASIVRRTPAVTVKPDRIPNARSG